MAEFEDHVEEVISSGELEHIVRQRERIGRFLRGLADHESRLAGVAVGHLEAMDRALDRGRTLARGAMAARARTGEAASVSVRVLAFVAENGRVRPRQLGNALELDASQVSRALAQLVATGQIARVEAPANADGRAHWYAAV